MINRGSLLRLSLLALVWGSSFLWIKLALRSLSPVQIVLVRLALGALVLLVFCRLRGLALPRGARRWSHLAVAALVANSVPYLLFAVGERTVDSSLAGVLNTTTPLWTITIGLAAQQERRVGGARGTGLVVGFAGALLVLSPWHATADVWGALACLGAALCYGIAYVYTGRYLSGWGVNPVAMVAGQLVAATALMAVVTPLAGTQPIHPRADALVGLAILGVLGTGIAYALNYRLVIDDGPTAASTVTYLLPVVSVLLGVAFLHEVLSFHVAVGLVLALLGVAMTRRRPPQPKPEPAPEPAPEAQAPQPVTPGSARRWR